MTNRLFIIFLLAISMCATSSCSNGEKQHYVNTYYEGDRRAFDEDLDKYYGGDFENMKKSLDEVSRKIENSNEKSSSINKVSGTAIIEALENDGKATVWSVPGTVGRAIWEVKNNDEVFVLNTPSFQNLSDYDYVQIKLKKTPDIVGYVYKYHLKTFKALN